MMPDRHGGVIADCAGALRSVMDSITRNTPVTGEQNGIAVITAGAETDVYTAHMLRDAIKGGIDHGHYRIVLDMRRLEYIDSTGLGVIVGALKRVRERDGRLALAAVGDRLAHLLRVTALEKVLDCYGTVDEAVTELGKGMQANG